LDFKFGAEYRVRFYTGVNAGPSAFGANSFNENGQINANGSTTGNASPRGAQLRIRPGSMSATTTAT